MKYVLIWATLFLLSSCGLLIHELPSTTEYVLSDGMTITATTPNGKVSITGCRGTKRIFAGDGWTKTRYLIPRDERWYGSLGLYDAAGSFTPYGRLLVDEGRLFFESKSAAERHLHADYCDPVYNDDGLAVGFRISEIPGGEPTRTVEIWQIYINGKKPTSLKGANNKAITVIGGVIPDTATPYPAVVGHEMEPD